jgi:hypothetical protein
MGSASHVPVMHATPQFQGQLLDGNARALPREGAQVHPLTNPSASLFASACEGLLAFLACIVGPAAVLSTFRDHLIGTDNEHFIVGAANALLVFITFFVAYCKRFRPNEKFLPAFKACIHS